MKTLLLTILFSFVCFLLPAQDLQKADSLIHVYEGGELDEKKNFELLAEISFYHTNPDIKLFYAKELIRLASEHPDEFKVFRGYYQAGDAYRLKGNLQDAIDAYLKSIRLAEKMNNKAGVGSAYMAIADVYSVGKNYHNSTLFYKKAIRIATENADSSLLGIALMNAGDDYYHADQIDSALVYLNRSGEIFEALDYEIGMAYNLGNLGLVYAKQGKYERAAENLAKANEILQKFEDYYPIAVYYLSMVEIFEQRQDIAQALYYAGLSLQLSEEHGLKEQIQEASLKLSELYAQTNDYQKAYLHHRQYVAYRDSVINEENIRNIAELRTEYEVSQKQAQIDLLIRQRQTNQIIGLILVAMVLLMALLAFLLYRNNSSRRAANKLLFAQNGMLEQQHQKLEALNNTKDRFFSIISHDLRAPLNAFNGISALIKQYIARNEMGQLRTISEHIDQSARQLSTLLDNLLDWSVKQQGTFPFRPEMLSLNPLLLQIVDMFRIAAHAKNITLHLDLEEEINVWADRNSLATIIRNLLNNALKFTGANGLVTLSAYTENGFVHINVIDTGLGIPEEKLENLFLLKEKPRGIGTDGEKGLGIGLSLVIEFAKMNGGTIMVNSEEGIGSIFTLKMPLKATSKNREQELAFEICQAE